ncbi:MAG: ExbD/TolR family protein [Flavobacterium sp.]|uniref:ExbD/TolR family protein n=1 Tax=Flavobacterium sp. TaxID=239 RepID=UPI00391CD61D
MAELNTGDSGGGKKGSKKVRSKKSNAKVDLTAMVDLAFLLITFFMLTTSLSKPQSMDLGLPDKDEDPTKNKIIKTDQRRTMTVILGKDSKIKWFHGLQNEPEAGGAPTDAVYGKNGIRKEILKRVVSVPQVTGDKKKGLIVIIKPTKKATYRNLVDILDEMAICDVPTYAIVNDISPEEQKLVDEMNK